MQKYHSIEFVYPDDPFLRSVAERLTKDFTSYRIPASVVKKTGIRSLEDVTEPWLIVLCSPETPDCREVRERIAAYTAEGRYHNILSLVVKGRSGECFPQELVFETRPDGTVVEHEPLAANISAGSEKESLRLLQVEKLRLYAPILGVSFDELRNRRLRNRIRIAAALGTVVLLGAAAFFGYAINRMTVMSGQNKELQLHYEQAQEARDRAREQRDAAREDFASTTAIRAREVLNKEDNELAMLLCLEFLPEAGLTTELPAILTEALQKLCAEGYVPVTTVREYGKTRYQPDPEESEDDSGNARGSFPGKISRPVPEDYDNGKETFAMNLEVASEEYGYAVYRGDFNYSKTSANDVFRSRVCFRDDPDRDFDMPSRHEAFKWLTADVILPDGSFIGLDYSSIKHSLYRYDPFAREFLPFYDETAAADPMGAEILPGDPESCREAGIHIGEIPGTPAENPEYFSPYALVSEVQEITEIPGVEGLVFGYTNTGNSRAGSEDDGAKVYVFTKAPFRYRYTMEKVKSLFRPEGSKYILGMTGKRVLVYSAEPFRYLYTLEDEYTTPLESYSVDIPYFPDGRSWLYVYLFGDKKAVYDLDTGKRMAAITDQGQDYGMEISSDGLILSSVRKVPTLWHPEDGSVFRTVPGAEEEEPELYGAYDEITGRRSADALRINTIVYEYRESAIPVPEDLAGQISLARQLLNGRKLTKKERKTYDLELTNEQKTTNDREQPKDPEVLTGQELQ